MDDQVASPDGSDSSAGLGLTPERAIREQKHTRTKCPESGLMCGYWINHYSDEATRWRKKAETLQQTVHNQRAELARLYGHKA